MKVDAHTHLFPQDYLKELEKLGTNSRHDRAWRRIMTDKVAVTPSMWSVEERLADMDAAGIDVQVLSLSIPNAYFEDTARSVYIAQMVNDIYADVCRRHPERFIAVASVPMNDSIVAIEELRRAVDRLGMRGLVLGANVRGRPLHSEEFLPLYEEINRLKLTLFLHPMIPIGIEALEQYDMAASIGYLFDTATAITGMVFRGIFEVNKNIKVVLPHLGAVIPFIVGRIDASFRTRPECRQHISSPPSDYFKRFYYDTVNYHIPALRCAIDTVGAANLVMGSDYPFALGSMSKSLSTIHSLGLTEEEEERIFGRSILSLLAPGVS